MKESDKSKTVVKRNIERWTRQYSSENPHVWGMDTSPSANYLLNSKAFKSLAEDRGKLNILEIGAGYGRDTNVFTALDHYVVAFEFAIGALSSALPTLIDQIPSNLTWIVADFMGYNFLRDEIFDVVFSHRTLHLLTEQNMIDAFKREITRVSQKGGIVCMSARDTRDFNPRQMAWIDKEKGIARYTLPERKDHIISFWSPERFEQEFSELFNIISLTQEVEPESVTNADTNSHFTIMLGVRR